MARNKKTSRVFEYATLSSGLFREPSGGAEAILKFLDGARLDFSESSESDPKLPRCFVSVVETSVEV